MNDTISRQQTITALRALSDEDGYINAPHEVVTDVVRGLPPVRAKHEQTTHSERGKTDKLAPKMGETWLDVTCPNCGCEIHIESEHKTDGDTISRQAALDALEKVAELFPWRVPGNRDSYDRYNEAWNDAIGRAEIEIEELPSAQTDKAKVLAEILDGCPLTHPCDKLWSPDGWCKDHCKNDYKAPSAECWLKYAEVMASDSTDAR